MAGDVCAFFAECPFVVGPGLVLAVLLESKCVPPSSTDSCKGEETKLRGRESRFE